MSELMKTNPEDRLALTDAMEIAALKRRIQDLEEDRRHLLSRYSGDGTLPMSPAQHDYPGVHIRVFSDHSRLADQNKALEGSTVPQEAFVHAMLLIDVLKRSGRKASNAPVREYLEDHIGEITLKLTEAIGNLGSIAVRLSVRNPFRRDEPVVDTWLDPKMDWRLVGLVPEPEATSVDEAFRKLCSTIGKLRDLGSRSDSGDAVRFDNASLKVGLSVITAAAQELASLAMPDVKFDTGAKTIMQQAEAVTAARAELRKDV